jgi:hypothetical protein
LYTDESITFLLTILPYCVFAFHYSLLGKFWENDRKIGGAESTRQKKTAHEIGSDKSTRKKQRAKLGRPQKTTCGKNDPSIITKIFFPIDTC